MFAGSNFISGLLTMVLMIPKPLAAILNSVGSVHHHCYSNTTLVKVKLNKINYNPISNTNSNTTLVKVK